MDILTAALILAGSAAIGWLMGYRKPENKIFRMIGVKSADGKYPHLIHKQKITGKTIYIIWVPNGIDMEGFLPNGKYNFMLRQSLANLKLTEVTALDGHRMAVTVYDGKLADMLPFKLAKGEALRIPIGESLKGVVYLQLGDAIPHVFLAGETGGGKSNLLKLIITWMLLNGVRLYLIDLKKGIEQKMFRNCRGVISYDRDVPGGLATLRVIVEEMDRRLDLLFESDATHYTELGLPPLVLIIDESADFAGCDEAGELLTKLGRLSRAAGIFTISATQRPDSKVMKSEYKANNPSCICFRVRDHFNSQIVLGHSGAEKLPGKGRCIFLSAAGEVELQAYYLSDKACKTLISGMQEHKIEQALDMSGVLE